MKTTILLLTLAAAAGLAGCAPKPPPQHELTQADAARFQAANFVLGMASLKAMSAGNQNESAIYLESLVYNAAVDILETPDVRSSPKVQAWMTELAIYRKNNPRPREARSPVDDRLDRLLADYAGREASPARPLPDPSSVGRQRPTSGAPVSGIR
ncbi:MAG: hypothetical protein NTW19_15715 [Planctomycetota bacterium]|nr:hypothetical protein [Planctomycetota bacterium]